MCDWSFSFDIWRLILVIYFRGRYNLSKKGCDDPFFLAGEVISEKYTLEYGTDCIEMHVGAVESGERALVVDDLIATGGTLCAAMNLLGTSS